MSDAAVNVSAETNGRANHHAIAIGVIVLAALLALPLLMNDYRQYIINLMLIYCLVSVGFNIVLGYLGQLAFANAALFGIGAYSTGILMEQLDVPFWLALPSSALIGAIAGTLIGLPALRLKSYYLAIATLVFGELLRWAYIHGGELTRGSSGLPVSTATVFGFPIDTETRKYYVFLIVTLVMLWATRNLIRSRIGRAWVAIRENELAAASLGISPALYKIAAFTWSGAVVGVAGALFAVLLGRIEPESFNLNQLLLHFTFVMIGGLGNMVGSILGSVVLTAAPEILRNFPGFEEIVFSLLLIGVLLFMPHGIGGLLVAHISSLREKLFRE